MPPPVNPDNETSNSSLSATSADMGDDGFATVQFYPGAFVTYGSPGYNATATGQVSVTALWISPQGTTVTRTVPLVWKNYPYLSTRLKCQHYQCCCGKQSYGYHSGQWEWCGTPAKADQCRNGNGCIRKYGRFHDRTQWYTDKVILCQISRKNLCERNEPFHR